MSFNKPEIMAPVGSFPALTAAIKAGASSVFFGVQQLNMRSRSSHNFKLEDIGKIVKQAEKSGVKTYVTLNTIVYDHDIALMQAILKKAKDTGVDAVIAADMATVQYATEIGLPIHASTQLSISNFEAVKFYSRYADIVVLAREVDLKMMKSITDRIKKEDLRGPSGELIKIEVFVHGALCIAQSGRCQMSLLQTNTSAQRGACLQECRKKYRVIDDETGKEMIIDNEYVMSPADLCTISFVDKLIEAGVSIFKIEGRGRSPEYVDTIVRTYREAVDSVADGTYTEEKVTEWTVRMSKVFNRGFTDGYYLGKALPDWSGKYGSHSKDERIFAGLVNHYFTKARVAEINLQASPIKKGDKLVLMGNTTGVTYCDAGSIRIDDKQVTEAKNPSTITIPLDEKVRKNDKVYIIKERIHEQG
ncbi:peptidase U32 family protein [Pseudomonadota bacterium]